MQRSSHAHSNLHRIRALRFAATIRYNNLMTTLRPACDNPFPMYS